MACQKEKKTILKINCMYGESNPLRNTYCSKQLPISTQPQQLYKTGQLKRQKKGTDNKKSKETTRTQRGKGSFETITVGSSRINSITDKSI